MNEYGVGVKYHDTFGLDGSENFELRWKPIHGNKRSEVKRRSKNWDRQPTSAGRSTHLKLVFGELYSGASQSCFQHI